MSDEISSLKLAKTEAGRAALGQRALCTPRERQIMILCDGRRTLLDLVEMMGEEVIAIVGGLQLKGYVLAVTPMLEKLAEFSATGTLQWASSQLLEEASGEGSDALAGSDRHCASRSRAGQEKDHRKTSEPKAAPPAKPLPAVTLRTANAKRSLAGSKMYLLDVLRTQRGTASQALVMQLQSVGNPEALLAETPGVIEHLYEQCGGSYAERVARHLLDSLPEDLVVAFCQQIDAMDLPGLRVASLLVHE